MLISRLLSTQFTRFKSLSTGALCLGLLSASGVITPCAAESKEFREQVAELRDMVETRDLEVYELDFAPSEIKRIVLTDRTGDSRVYHYLTFRLQNRVSDATLDQRAQGSNAYNEVLLTVADEFDDVEVDGTSLRVEVSQDHEGQEVVVDRSNLNRRTRRAMLSILAFDENGTRFRVLDEDPGQGPQERFNFDDEGDRSVAYSPADVRDAVEEKEGRRLLTLKELSEIDLPPYEGGELDEYGAARGEAYGVVIFDRLSIYGDKFIVQIRGLSNKQRERTPLAQAGDMEDYFNTRIYRRAYEVTYTRPGDEFYLDLSRFQLEEERWTWHNTFQRIESRHERAKARYFLQNIEQKNKANRAVVDEFRDQYNALRDELGGDQLFDLDEALGLK